MTSEPESNIIRQAQIIDILSFDKAVASYDWDGFLCSASGVDLYTEFVRVLNSITEAAKRTVTLKKRRPHHEWLTYDILKKIKEKRFVEPMSEVS